MDQNIKEYDDTDRSATRIHEIHGSRSITFYEIDHKGNKVTRITERTTMK